MSSTAVTHGEMVDEPIESVKLICPCKSPSRRHSNAATHSNETSWLAAKRAARSPMLLRGFEFGSLAHSSKGERVVGAAAEPSVPSVVPLAGNMAATPFSGVGAGSTWSLRGDSMSSMSA